MTKTERRPRRTRKIWIVLGLVVQWLFRLAIAVVGLSVLAGTLLAVWRSHTTPLPVAVEQVLVSDASLPETPPIPDADLRSRLEKLLPARSSLVLHMALLEVSGGTAVAMAEAQGVSGGGLLRLPILATLLMGIDRGEVGWQGELQRAMVAMCRTGDNSATNLLIGRLGGMEVLNQRWREWGLSQTKLVSLFPDGGANTTSVQDVQKLLGLVERGKLLRLRTRDRFWDCLSRTESNSLLPAGIGGEGRIWHLAGSGDGWVGDGGMVDLPNGRRYLLAVILQHQNDSETAGEVLRQLSALIYDYLNRSAIAP